MLAEFTPGGVGLYKDKVYSLGQFDVALLNYARKSVLEKYDIRIPTLDKPWTLDEFNAASRPSRIPASSSTRSTSTPEYTGEWWSYAYSPMLQASAAI